MPEFILELGSDDAAKAFNALGEFEQGYIECAFFCMASGIGISGADGVTNPRFDELSTVALAWMLEDCRNFMASDEWQAWKACEYVCGEAPDDRTSGRCFWYTRNRHGTGFWDHDYPDAWGATLTDAAHDWPECDLYIGDHGLIEVA